VVPFLPAQQPALGVSSLQSVLQRDGIEADVRYLNLEYGERAGWEFYRYLVEGIPTHFLPGEMIFSQALWGDRAPRFDTYAGQVREWFERFPETPERLAKGLENWRRNALKMQQAMEEAPRLVSAWADVVLAGRPRVLGFTSTFQQNVAALALAQEVRRRVPAEEVAILFGGANCEDDMGRAMAESFPFVDCVVSGEGEKVILDLVRSRLDGSSQALPRFVQGVTVGNMDELPTPSFDDYFDAVRRTWWSDKTWLAAESSRGCWWGAKSHCTFCGLNGGTMGFRSKSPDRFAAELDALSQKYNVTRFAVTDNILDMSYLRTLVPNLVKGARSYFLFYETKSNLRKDQVELLAAAGVGRLQPGIESFSTPILKLMNKGTTRLQNVQLLKWCAELGVVPAWNLLAGFPGEAAEDYEEMAELLPSLYHLPPPGGFAPVRVDRFGPYWKTPKAYGLRNVRPYWSYDHAYAGLAPARRERLAYFFEHQYDDGRDPSAYTRPLAERTSEWRHLIRRQPIHLELQVSAAGASVFDTRPCAIDEVYPLDEVDLALLQVLDGIRGRGGLGDALRERGIEIDEAECDARLEGFKARRFVLEEGGCWLSLVTDPRERDRVARRKVILRASEHGLRWPEDFPDPAARELVRAAMLALETPRDGAAAHDRSTRLAHEVASRLSRYPDFGVFDDVTVAARGTTVILQGTVTREHKAEELVGLARCIPGVQDVVNGIETILPSPADSEARLRVLDRLYPDRGALRGRSPIRVLVKDGGVILTGAVPSEEERLRAEAIALETPGTSSVTNRLTVVSAPAAAAV
jgi:ribosomal peptide maturation radical SAM protein 1